MGGYIRTASNIFRKSGRSLATVTALPQDASTSSSSPATPDGPLRPHLRIPVNPKHGLYHFFRHKTDHNSHTKLAASGQPEYVALEPPMPPRLLSSGRSWETTELRRKSFKDLHTLWYILLRERNLLATQAAEKRRLQIFEPVIDVRAHYCRRSMARIKAVITERQYAYRQALRLRRQGRGTPELGQPADVAEDSGDAMLESGESKSVATGKTP